MKLNLKERLVVLNSLPAQGDITTLRIIGDLRRNLSPTEQEYKDMKIIQKDAQSPIEWDTKKGLEEVDIEIGEKATDIIVEALKKINDEKKLTEDHMSAYEKFIEKV